MFKLLFKMIQLLYYNLPALKFLDNLSNTFSFQTIFLHEPKSYMT